MWNPQNVLSSKLVTVSLSTLVLIVEIDKEIYGFLKKHV